MKEKIIKVYEFNELKPKIQEKVLNEFREKEDFSFLNESLNDYLKELLKDKKIKSNDLKLNYSLNYCQGDGLSFTGRFEWKNYEITIFRKEYHYCHKYTTNFNILTKKGNNVKESILNEFEALYYSICDKVEKMGYSIIEETLKDETIKDLIEMNEYTFRENGEIENL